MSAILVIDDDKALCRSLELQFKVKGHQARSAFTAHDGLEVARNWSPDMILLDLNLPDQSGLDILPQFFDNGNNRSVVIMTADPDNKMAIEAMRFGAFDYLRKPFDIQEALNVIKKINQKKQTAIKEEIVQDDDASAYQLVGSHPTIVEIHKMIGLLSRSRVTVMIQGESGTGKELVARILHETDCPDRPFVAINCSAVVPTLLESEFFGHEKGAFTGADKLKIGKLEHAAEGTVFLDEIGDMHLDLQAKLLRVLQEEEFTRVGGLATIPLKARIVVASHQDLRKLVETGKFRQDLYYRLTVSTIVMPPVRQRKIDIPILVNHLLKKISSKLHRQVTTVSDDVMQLLLGYDFPGNVRELENILTRAVVLAKGNTITVEDLEFSLKNDEYNKTKNEPVTLADAEKSHIKLTLDNQKWNITRTAKILAISPTTLRKKITDYQLDRPAN